MIVVDDAMIPAQVRNYKSEWSHMMSTLPGEAGTAELVDFAKGKLKMIRGWIQHEGESREHFDLTKGKREEALRHGAAPITWRQAAEIMEAKEEGREWTP